MARPVTSAAAAAGRHPPSGRSSAPTTTAAHHAGRGVVRVLIIGSPLILSYRPTLGDQTAADASRSEVSRAQRTSSYVSARDEATTQQTPPDRRPDHTFSGMRSPIKPVGRTRRTRIRITNATTSLYSLEMYPAPSPSAMPNTTPPTIAPGMLPIPPKTAAVKALMPATYPMKKLTTP